MMKPRKQIYIILVLLLCVYLKAGFIVQAGIVLLSVHYLIKEDDLNLFCMFFSIFFLLPYDYNSRTLGVAFGNYLDNSFLAGLPLYIGFPLVLRRRVAINRKLTWLMIYVFAIFLISTVGKGVLELVGGGERVRLAWAINYFNVFVIVVWTSRVMISSERIKEFTRHIVWLGFFVSLFGLAQYIFKFYFFEYSYAYPNVERLNIIPFVDPVDLFPFFIVPFSFAINYLYGNSDRKKRVFIIAAALIGCAEIFTWARWGVVCMGIAFILALLLNRRMKTAIVMAIVVVSLQFIDLNSFINFVPSDQVTRLYSEGNLTNRYLLWGGAIRAIESNWMVGTGIGNSALAVFRMGLSKYDVPGGEFMFTDVSDFRLESIHQFFLNWVLTMGVFIVPAIMLLYFMFFKNTVAILRSQANHINLCASKAMLCAMVGISLFWMLNSGDNYFWLFVLLAMSFTILNIRSNELGPEPNGKFHLLRISKHK